MNGEKKMQISTTMFFDVYRLIADLEGYVLDINTKKIIKRLEAHINAKLDAIIKRQAYTVSKMGTTEEEKEQARQEYLDLVGMHEDWRYSREYLNKSDRE